MDSTPGTFELLKRLNDAGVDYVIVGGIAAILHGSPRITIDIDVCAPLTEPNLSRILLVLRGLHPKFRMRPDKLPMPDDASRLQGFKNLNLDTDLGILEAVSKPRAGVSRVRQPLDGVAPPRRITSNTARRRSLPAAAGHFAPPRGRF